MRATADQALLRTAQYDVYGRLFVEDLPLTDLLGFNPLRAAQWTAHQDQLAASGSLTLHLTAPGASTSPLLPSSLGAGRPEPGKTFALQTATVAKGATPNEGNYATVFDGEIDAADVAGEAVVLECRDGMARWQDQIIEPNDLYYGNTMPSGTMETTLLRIMSLGTAPPPGTVLVGQGDPDWTVIAYAQQAGIGIAEALHAVVLQRGWAIHYRYAFNDPAAAGVVTYYDPVRSAVTIPNYVVEPSEITRYQRLRLDRARVRNVIEMIYGVDRTRLKVEDAASIAAYGRRYMLFSEDATGQIDTALEAGRMLDAALADQKDPGVECDYERLYFWPVELGDKHAIQANARRHAELNVSVKGYTHSLDWRPGGQFRSTIRTENVALAAKLRWRKLEPRMVHVSLSEPLGIAPQGALWLQVTDRTLPPAA